ncbi:MAG TPA: hypothetical protein VNH22_11860 [Blastocatellia bacterium]|jgi:hypothetical protein|nr:hypothetical protein [Blastocatellia bacterium]
MWQLGLTSGDDESNPATVLVAKKAGKKIDAGETVTLQVRDPGKRPGEHVWLTGNPAAC